jgi:sulfotransferase
MENKIFFTSSMPRSGSTLLMNILGQNEKNYVTPTSGLIELIVGVKNSWRNHIEFKAEGLDIIQPRIENTMAGIINGYFKKEFEDGKIVFDKSRGWLQYIEILEKILNKKIKIIVTIRDIRSVVASFEKIYRNRGIDYIDASGDAFFKCQTVYGRAEELLRPSSVVGIYINRLRDALQRGVADRIIFVRYRDLMTNPKIVVNNLCDKLEIDRFEFDPNNIKQVTHENDVWHGMNLHKIRSKIEPPEEVPWEKILPKDLAEKLRIEYSDINSLS